MSKKHVRPPKYLQREDRERERERERGRRCSGTCIQSSIIPSWQLGQFHHVLGIIYPRPQAFSAAREIIIV